MTNLNQKKQVEERLLNARSGGFMLLVIILSFVVCVALYVAGAAAGEGGIVALAIVFMILATLLLIVACVALAGFRVVNPNEAVVLVFFGKYYGTIGREGFYWVNPFCVNYNPATKGSLVRIPGTNTKISLKAMTLNNEKQKINDSEGNPIEIGVVLIWKVVNTAKAAFNVENYPEFVSIQADAATRQVVRQFPYDVSSDGDEKSLRGSSTEVSRMLMEDLQKRVEIAGIEIIDARISHLAYSAEIAAAMLQRQQASAIIAARQKIVEGAVGMVEMALAKLNEGNIVQLDDERKAAMVSNLLVVLCGNRDAQPIVNSGSIY